MHAQWQVGVRQQELRHIAHFRPARLARNLARTLARSVRPLEKYLPRVPALAQQAVQKRCLAGAVGAHKNRGPPGRGRGRDVLKDHASAGKHADMLKTH